MENIAQQIHKQLGVDEAAFKKQVKGDVSWDDFANGLEPSLRDLIANVAVFTNNTIQLVESQGVGNAEFFALSRGTMRDCKGYADRLNQLISRRGDRTGPTKNSNDYTDYISIGVELTNMTEEIQTVSTTSMISMTEFEQAALDKIREAEAAAAAADQDVEVKEAEPLHVNHARGESPVVTIVDEAAFIKPVAQ